MNLTLDSLHRFLHSGAGFERLLVAPTRSAGEGLLDRYAAAHGGVLGLRAETPFTLARELCARRGLSRPLLGREAGAVLVLELLRRGVADPAAPMDYFRAVGGSALTLATAREALSCLLLLEQEDKTLAGAAGPRTAALDWLFRAYQEKKAALGVWDRWDLLRAAAGEVKVRPVAIPAALCGDLRPCGLERTFLAAACPAATVLPVPVWEGLPADPRALSLAPVRGGAALRFSRGHGAENEALFPLWDVLERQIPFGRAAVVCADPALLPLLRAQAAQLGVPATFAEGFPLSEGALLPLLTALRDWLGQDCPVEGLPALMAGGLAPPSRAALMKFLRKNNVGWGAERYAAALAAARTEAAPLPEEDRALGERLIARYDGWEAFFTSLFALAAPGLSAAEGLAALTELLAGHYGKSADRAAECAALALLGGKLLSAWEGGPFSAFSAFFDTLLACAPWMSWGAASPRDGAVHITRLSGAPLPGRTHTYVLGLGQDSLTAARRESPLLRDEERRALGLPASDADALLPAARLGQLLADAEGEVVLSYAAFDGEKMLPLAPAPVYELLRRGADAPLFHYRRPVSFTAAERWLSDGTLPAAPALPHTAVDPAAALKDFCFSPTSLETAMECPRRFCFRYLLNIPQPDRPSLSEDAWLPANALGELVHLALERYFTGAAAGGGDFEGVWALCLDQFRQHWPAPSPALMERDAARAEAMARQAVSYFRTRQAGSRPLAAELAFGREGLPTAALDGRPFAPPSPFELDWGGGTIRFTGTVDRLDRLPSGGLAILDYKTGSASRFLNGLDHKLQYYLYARAVEQLCPGERVEEASYLLLSPDGVRPVTFSGRPGDDPVCRAKLARLLERLSRPETAAVRRHVWDPGLGDFTAPAGKERDRLLSDCAKWCPYAAICKEVGE